MTRHRCASCGEAIPNGTGHIRSECFRQLAWCDVCWLVGKFAEAALEPTVPGQRRRSELESPGRVLS